MGKNCYLRGVAALVIALLSISYSIAFSPWFNLLDNALSDLGDFSRSNVAYVFNFGLFLSGIFIVIYALIDVLKFNSMLAYLMEIAGSFLLLIGILNESYGYIHFAVSAFFFASLALLLIAFSKIFKTAIPVLTCLFLIVLWIIHLSFDIPKGAAIPEILSIVSIVPWYLKLVKILCSNSVAC